MQRLELSGKLEDSFKKPGRRILPTVLTRMAFYRHQGLSMHHLNRRLARFDRAKGPRRSPGLIPELAGHLDRVHAGGLLSLPE
jgi:hypothetical protein